MSNLFDLLRNDKVEPKTQPLSIQEVEKHIDITRKWKYIDEHIVEQSPWFFKEEKDGEVMTFINPTVEKQAEYGFVYDLVDTPYPETDEGYYRDFKYEIQGDTIVKVWSEPIPYDEEKTSLLNSLGGVNL